MGSLNGQFGQISQKLLSVPGENHMIDSVSENQV